MRLPSSASFLAVHFPGSVPGLQDLAPASLTHGHAHTADPVGLSFGRLVLAEAAKQNSDKHFSTPSWKDYRLLILEVEVSS